MILEFLAAAAYIAAHAAAGAVVGGAIGYLVGSFIDEVFLQDAIEEKYPDAFKILIKQKKKKAVNVGIFDVHDNTIESSVEIESEQGVSDALYKGQVIYV